MSLQEAKKKRGRPKGSKNKPKRTPVEKPVRTPVRKPVAKPTEPCPNLTKALDTILEEPTEEITEEPTEEPTVFKDEITGHKKPSQWINEATKAKKSLITALTGLKQIRERIDLVIKMTEEANNLQDFMDAINGSVNTTAGLIFCDDKNGWMDITYCHINCPATCYKYNTERWVCSILRCSNEKITMCDEKDSRCPALSLIMDFAHQYQTLGNKVAHEATQDGNTD